MKLYQLLISLPLRILALELELELYLYLHMLILPFSINCEILVLKFIRAERNSHTVESVIIATFFSKSRIITSIETMFIIYVYTFPCCFYHFSTHHEFWLQNLSQQKDDYSDTIVSQLYQLSPAMSRDSKC